MSRSKLIVSSIVCGILITFVLTWAAFTVESETVSRALMWQAAIPVYLIGPGPVIGHDDHGAPIHEGTPVHMLAGLVGILLGIPIYSVACYFALRSLTREKSGTKADGSPGRTPNDV